ncbi:MAG: hypothetical protein JRS35_03970 [Deltaproteobacteria bacterium]|nr:hypothetical protein [Deltaproteobacteria bacterium]
MGDVAFYASRWTVWKAWIALVVIVIVCGVLYHKDAMFSMVLLVLFGLLMVRGLLRRSRPLVEISGDVLTWRSMVGIGWDGAIALEEVMRVDPKYLWYMVLETRSGKRRWIHVGEIERSRRKAVRDAIATRLAGSAG